MDALHLHAVADIDAGGADGDALAAVDAIAHAVGAAAFHRERSAKFAPLFTALVIVGYNHRVLIEHRGLHTAVGADEGASLLAKPCENREENQRK